MSGLVHTIKTLPQLLSPDAGLTWDESVKVTEALERSRARFPNITRQEILDALSSQRIHAENVRQRAMGSPTLYTQLDAHMRGGYKATRKATRKTTRKTTRKATRKTGKAKRKTTRKTGKAKRKATRKA